MASMMQPWLLLCTFFVFLTSTIPFSACQSDSPRNIETFYPFESPPVSPTPTTPNNSPVNQEQVQSLLPPPPKSSSSNNTIAKAVAATAASTLVFAGLCIFFIQRWSVARQRKRDKVSTGSSRVGSVAPLPGFDGNLKGLIVDENGLDVVYWRKLEGIKYKNSYRKEVLHNHDNEEEDHKNEEEDERGRMDGGERNMESEHIQEAPLLGGKSSASEIPIPTKVEDRNPILPKTLPLPPPLPLTVTAIPKKENPAPPPPPITPKKNPLPPPPPPKSGGSAVPPRPPPAPGPIRKQSDGKPGETPSGVGKSETENDQVKLKPLHWEKVNASADHSMVWHKLDGGSFTFDGDLMEALFGSVAGDRKSPQRNTNSSNPITSNSVPAAQIFILESRKSQNTAIVLRSLTISRKEILDALIEGQGLNLDTLEKLTRIAPTKEEESQIIAFSGDPTRLADAESFLYHLLKAVPTAFPRLDAMFFRSNYVFEILHLKEFIQTLESGCKELQTRGLFLKLLEAVLKSGNRMNAGTARGNAQAFNLTALRKLSDVKSTDGKTTLLHFVVEEVVRSEGKRCVLNRNHSLTRSSSSSSNSSSQNSENSASKEEREKEYIKLGLPVVGGLSAEFSNVKKAAMIDHDGFAKTCSVLTARLAEIQQIVAQCAINTGGGGFVREMNGFIESAEGELKEVREEQTRVMELVKKTTEYYQAASLKDKEAHPLLLFVIVKDFLGMVDHVCVDIARNMQKRRTPTTTPPGSSSSPKSPAVRSPVKFPILPEHFMSDKSSSTSSESSDDD